MNKVEKEEMMETTISCFEYCITVNTIAALLMVLAQGSLDDVLLLVHVPARHPVRSHRVTTL